MSFKIVPVMIIAPIVNWKVNVASGNRNLEFLVWFNTTIFEQKKRIGEEFGKICVLVEIITG